MNFDASILKPGDVLLYFTHDFIDDVIAEKTGKPVGHIEVYAGDGKSMASRNGIGVNVYPLRLDGLICVRRPDGELDFATGMDWFNTVANGQGYDFEGLLTFACITTHGHEGQMFCSEFALNFFRACGFQPFNSDQPSYETSPRDFWICGRLETIWSSNQELYGTPRGFYACPIPQALAMLCNLSHS